MTLLPGTQPAGEALTSTGFRDTPQKLNDSFSFCLFASQKGFRVLVVLNGQRYLTVLTELNAIIWKGFGENNKIQSSLKEQVYGSSFPYILLCAFVILERKYFMNF